MAIVDQLATLKTSEAVAGLEVGERLAQLIATNDSTTIAALKALAVNSSDIAFWTSVQAAVTAYTGGGASGPTWTKYTVSTADLGDSNPTQAITLFTASAEEIIDNVIIKHSAQFTGPALNTCTVEVGVSGDTEKYAPAFDLTQAVAASARESTNVVDIEPSSVAVQALVTADINVDLLTAGSVDIWVQHGTL